MYIGCRKEAAMHKTKVFRNGNSQAVRIPADLAYNQPDVDLEIERVGDELRIRPLRPSLGGVLNRFARFGSGFMVEGRGEHRQTERPKL
jgi:antitoxin VapB